MSEVAPSSCPWCTTYVDAAEKSEGCGRPSPGDVTICLYCARASVFDDAMGLRKPTQEESAELHTDERVLLAISMVKRYGPRSPGGLTPKTR